jgi:PKD domain
VEDIAGKSATTTKRIAVEAAPPQPPPPPPPPDPPPSPPYPPPPPPNQPPTAAFVALPTSPLVREEVTFVSYSDDRDGRITEHAWDMNGDGVFDDATGPVATRRFSAPGERTVTLRVTDDKGASSTLSRTVVVREQPAASTTGPSPPGPRQLTGAPTAPPRLLSPFPIVRLVGSVTQAGTRIRLLAVRAPRGAQALVRCRGDGCPVKRARKLVGRVPARFAALHRLLPAHAVLEVLVRRGDRIGKYTRFKLRPNRLPQRTDGCLWPGTTRMAPCPEG